MPAAEGEKLAALLDSLVDKHQTDEPPPCGSYCAGPSCGLCGGRPSRAIRRADALMEVTQAYADANHSAVRGSDRARINVTVDLDTLRRGIGCTETTAGPMSAQQLRLLACDAEIIPMVLGGLGILSMWVSSTGSSTASFVPPSSPATPAASSPVAISPPGVATPTTSDHSGGAGRPPSTTASCSAPTTTPWSNPRVPNSTTRTAGKYGSTPTIGYRNSCHHKDWTETADPDATCGIAFGSTPSGTRIIDRFISTRSLRDLLDEREPGQRKRARNSRVRSCCGSRSTWSGEPSSSTRPSSMKMTRSAAWAAKLISWVTTIIVYPSAAS